MEWELTEVPGNLTTSIQDSTVDVVAAKIESKLANTLIRQLSHICPLENLRHVKRVRRRTECGKSELSIILCLSTGYETCSKQIPDDVQKIVDTYHLNPFAAKVSKRPATSKEEWEEQCKLWPTSYHPAHDLDIVRGFREEELPSIFNCMKTAIQLSKVGNTAVIVDPSSTQIIAKATDQTHQHDTSEEGNKFSEVRADDTCSLSEPTDNDGNLLLPRFFLSKPNSLNMEVSCINPWGWTKQRTMEQKPLPSKGCFAWHPLRHAAMVAIENAAERDRMMFPSSTSITKPDSNGNLENYNEPAKRLKTDTKDKEQSADESCCSDLSETSRPYLCTGFDIYLVWEPCTMCAMALVHHRFKRVFYALPNPVNGALGGVYRLHGEKSLNHHYNVFRVSVPEAYLNGLNDGSKQC
ncbi:hypothetical protein PAHAL_7G023100 [Panicum hallii]|uniref:CMP/dCMP-type deaminase domain-containing protein n=1 Tax=Panicum hallii TaxID=206008 RepID=A0A2S3I530_9POAL|nr:tRNA-specific adenosine deaminase TAD3-like [Panicum hallii]PAN36980.1 hypothetical protein PAHAL_7G023100 [Panicum hallii]